MDIRSYGVSKLEYKRNLGGSINKIIEYKSKYDIFINAASHNEYGIAKITDIIDKGYLKRNNIEYLIDGNKVLPLGIIVNKRGCNSIKFYIRNNEIDIDKIISSIEYAICTKMSSLK